VLFLHPDDSHTLTDLATRVGAPLMTAHRELQRLEDAGLLLGRQTGRSRLLRANMAHRASGPLAQLLLITFGPHVVIAEEFASLPHATHVLIYGSWAARYEGVTGREPGDVDVLVVGSPDRAGVYAAAERAEARLNVSVNSTIRATARWDSGDDPLVQSIRANPFVVIATLDDTPPAAPALGAVVPQ
jgi:hypothetical protein